jgi:hypothetical protein
VIHVWETVAIEPRSNGVNAELGEILARLRPDKRLTQDACEFLDKEIRRGADLNLSQREGVFAIVQTCLEHGLALSAPYESFWAVVYQEWCSEANTSEEGQKKLARLMQAIEADPALAPLVARTARHIQRERAARRQELTEAAAAPVVSAAKPARVAKAEAKPEPNARAANAPATPNAYVKLMQSARLGIGDALTANLELAAQYADEAVATFPNAPKVLFEAGGCHQLFAEKGTLHSADVRYVHMKKAAELYQQCLTLLGNQPYVTLKGEYDQWRKGLSELIVKVQKELASLEEQTTPVLAPAPETGPVRRLLWGGVAVAVVLVLALFIFFGLAREGSPHASVFGKVMYNNKPLTSGTVKFVGEDGHSQARIAADGSYQIMDAPLGPVKVSVRSMSTSVQKGNGDKIKWVTKSLIPARYNDPYKSGLNFVLENGRQEIRIDLKDY